jgi:Zn-dependent protease with chaperone function
MKIQMKITTLTILGLILLLMGAGFALVQKHTTTMTRSSTFPLRIPKAISCDAFQRTADRDLMARLGPAEAMEFTKQLDSLFVKPFVDDVHTRSLSVDGLEVTRAQFPALHSIILDCGRVLHITQIPRVFVVERTGLLIGLENFSEPVIVIHTSVLRRFKDQGELRFLIGRELGHLRAGHARWQSVLRTIQSGANQVGVETPIRFAILPLLNWAREAEKTADNAGLICTQDIKTAERALVRLATGIDDYTLRDISVDDYLKQPDSSRLSDFSRVALIWKEWNRAVPFAGERITELRSFESSDRYRNLWK